MNTRYAWFATPPHPDQRRGRYVVGGSDINIFAPVEAGTEVDANGQRALTLRTTAVAPKPGKHGILIYENPFGVVPLTDPARFAQGDFDTAPSGVPCQLVSGRGIKVRLRNVADDNFQGQVDYPAITVVAGLGATPTLAVDDYIGPGPGDTSNGLWQEADLAHAWGIVTAVYDTDELDFELVF